MRIALMSSAAFALLLSTGSAVDAQVSVGVVIGRPPAPVVIEEPPPPPRVYAVAAQPGPEFVWVEGYWYPQGRHYRWHDGYWTRPPSVGAYWVEPYYYRGSYVAGYWQSGGHHDGRERREDRREDRREERHRR
jgi:YXWGXW repeat-containing protein